MHVHAAFGLSQLVREADEFAALGGVHGEIIEALAESLPDVRIEIVARHLCPAMALGQSHIGVALQALAGDGKNAHVPVQSPFAMQVIERGDELVQRQVTGAAEDQHVAGNGHDITPT